MAGQAVHCHLVRSPSAFAIVANGFDRTSSHGFLAKRFLLRGGRLLKHIGVAAVVAAREISGGGFPAQVAVNALVIDVKLSGHVFRVFIRNVGHRFSFVSCRPGRAVFGSVELGNLVAAATWLDHLDDSLKSNSLTPPSSNA